VTGGINCGKTTTLCRLFKEEGLGDGFILPKVFYRGKYTGQRIVRLSTGESVSFSFKDEFIPEGWNEKYRYDVYSFSKEGLDFADLILKDIIEKRISPVFVDEIGPLELQEKGFFNLFSSLLGKTDYIFVSVRQDLLLQVVKKFNIKNYKIFSAKP
jgi:nucleoside-triphosphatase THEP1